MYLYCNNIYFHPIKIYCRNNNFFCTFHIN